MKRVLLVPLSDVSKFHGLEVIARNGSLAALAGDTAPGRARSAYESEEAFLDAVALDFADRYTFPSLIEASAFAQAKLVDLAQAAQKIEAQLLSKSKRDAMGDKSGHAVAGLILSKGA